VPGDGDQAGWGQSLAALAALGLSSESPFTLTLPQAFVVAAGATTMAMAFMLFGKRRRDGEPTAPDEVLEAAAAGASRIPADASLASATPPVDPDLLMPRWRRPSLLQARKSDPVRDAVPIVPMSFRDAAGTPGEGIERRVIRYHMVELLDAPDELRSRPVGSLTHGDEVQLLERSGSYWRILCPDGQQGWVHRMTLGAPVGSEADQSAVEAWAIPAELIARVTPEREPEPETDLFATFLAARRADA
jgi:hypothetical protein